MRHKPIQTVYEGYRFRSRLEARWAVFLDALGVRWDYEIEGFELNSGWYLPDFWLPDDNYWLEIKPDSRSLSVDEMIKARELRFATGLPVVIAQGLPDENNLACFLYTQKEGSTDVKDLAWGSRFGKYREGRAGFIRCYDVLEQPGLCVVCGPPEDGYYADVSGWDSVRVDYETKEIRNCSNISFVEDASTYEDMLSISRDTQRAAMAAKQARFEHGQTPVFDKRGVYTG